METTIKQAEEERNRSLENAKKMYEEFRPIKEELDHVRTVIGLEKVSDVQDEDEKITPE